MAQILPCQFDLLYFFSFLQFPLHQHSFSHSDVDGLCLCLAAAGMEIISQRLS